MSIRTLATTTTTTLHVYFPVAICYILSGKKSNQIIAEYDDGDPLKGKLFFNELLKRCMHLKAYLSLKQHQQKQQQLHQQQQNHLFGL